MRCWLVFVDLWSRKGCLSEWLVAVRNHKFFTPTKVYYQFMTKLFLYNSSASLVWCRSIATCSMYFLFGISTGLMLWLLKTQSPPLLAQGEENLKFVSNLYLRFGPNEIHFLACGRICRRALRTVTLETIRKWGQQMYRWMDAYRGGSSARDLNPKSINSTRGNTPLTHDCLSRLQHSLINLGSTWCCTYLLSMFWDILIHLTIFKKRFS